MKKKKTVKVSNNFDCKIRLSFSCAPKAVKRINEREGLWTFPHLIRTLSPKEQVNISLEDNIETLVLLILEREEERDLLKDDYLVYGYTRSQENYVPKVLIQMILEYYRNFFEVVYRLEDPYSLFSFRKPSATTCTSIFIDSGVKASTSDNSHVSLIFSKDKKRLRHAKGVKVVKKYKNGYESVNLLLAFKLPTWRRPWTFWVSETFCRLGHYRIGYLP